MSTETIVGNCSKCGGCVIEVDLGYDEDIQPVTYFKCLNCGAKVFPKLKKTIDMGEKEEKAEKAEYEKNKENDDNKFHPFFKPKPYPYYPNYVGDFPPNYIFPTYVTCML